MYADVQSIAAAKAIISCPITNHQLDVIAGKREYLPAESRKCMASPRTERRSSSPDGQQRMKERFPSGETA
jgi:hypothetical protein